MAKELRSSSLRNSPITYGLLVELNSSLDTAFSLSYPEQLQGSKKEFNTHFENASYRKMKDWSS